MFKKICLLSVLCVAMASSLQAQSHHYYLGTLHLAGMVPENLPAAGSVLSINDPDLPVLDFSQGRIGYIPRKFREPIARMMQDGLDLHMEVCHVFSDPLPGKFLTVEVWVTTGQPEKIHALIYSLPAEEAQSVTALND